MRILFSPVGTTDPISNNNYKDGSMLHIARVYKPDKIVMYMSKEMLDNQEKDDRYRYCIRQLDKLNSTQTEIEIIERPDLTRVNEFDYFYEDFKEILDSYVKKLGEDDELLVNISSGTPQMKSGLAVLQTILVYKQCRLIQVVTPEGRSNTHKPGECDIKLLWEYCEDNDKENFENRCKEIVCPSLSTIKMEEIIKKHILAYDYAAALSIAEELPQKSTESYIHLLRYAKARLQLNEIEVNNIKSANNECDFLPVKKSEQRKIVEYTLALDVKRKRGEFADFLRAITPLFVELFNNILKNCFKYDLNDFTETVKGEFRWKDDEINEKLNKVISYKDWKKYRKNSVTSYHLYVIMNNLPKTDEHMIKAFEIVKKLRKVESDIRNKAAHQMVSVTDDKIQDITHMNSEGIMKKIRELFNYSDINIPKQGGWNSYELMNDSIIAKISQK